MGLIGIVVLLVFCFLNVPVGFVMILVGFFGMWLVKGFNPALSLISNEPFTVSSTYVYSVIAFFTLMGYTASHTRISADAFYFMDKWLGQLKGGLAMGTIAAAAIFAAICGNPIATASTVCTAALDEMRKYRYNDELSLGTIAAGGNLGFLFPPSLAFIIYGVMTQMSIGSLFMAGIMPGILLAVLMMATIYIMCWFRPSLSPKRQPISWKERVVSIPRILPVLIIIILVLGGIYAGIFTPTEAGAVGVFGVMLVAFLYKQLNRKTFIASIRQAAIMSAMVFILIIGAMIFSRFLVVTEVPSSVAKFAASLEVPRIVILATVLIIYGLLGCVIDIMAMVIVIIPIIHPLLVSLGYEPLFIATVIVLMVLVGNISPPFGIVVFTLSGMVRDVALFRIFRGVLPFIGAMIACVVIIIIFPQIATWLPGMMMKGG
jgi:tripartite ATP-independent transporter DctM subunit